MNQNSVFVEEFLDTVRKETETNEKYADIPFLDFWNEKYKANALSFDRRGFLCDVTQLNVHNQINYYQELTSYRKGLSSIVIRFKKLIRKSVAFIFLPLIAEQNAINANNMRIAVYLRGYVNSELDRADTAMKRVRELEMQTENQQKMIAELIKRVNTLSQKCENIEKRKEN